MVEEVEEPERSAVTDRVTVKNTSMVHPPILLNPYTSPESPIFSTERVDGNYEIRPTLGNNFRGSNDSIQFRSNHPSARPITMERNREIVPFSAAQLQPSNVRRGVHRSYPSL